MLLVVGLGNPEPKYAQNRHNVGFMAVDELASLTRAEAFRKKFSGEIARTTLGGVDAVLLKPLTYMNLSGDAVQPCAAFFKVAPAAVIVVHDELDLPFGEVRLKLGGGHAGHNGVRSVIARLGTPEFGRVRVGIGRPPESFKGDVADWVLQDFSSAERSDLPNSLRAAAQSVLDIAARGFRAAMNARNTRQKPKPEATPPDAPGASKRG